MKIHVKTNGGGIFSHFYLALRNVEFKIKDEDIDSIESIYLEPNSNTAIGQKCIGFNPFDFTLDQEIETFDIYINSNNFAIHENIKDIDSKFLNRMRRICDKVLIKKEIIKSINSSINENTLGVHIRLTDMFEHHPEYISKLGNSTEAYINKTISLIEQNHPIFVASDNKESLIKFQKKFNVIFNNSRNISETEYNKDYLTYQINNIDKQWFWNDSFLDMISLSKCGSLLYNVSSLNTTSFLYSKSIINTYRVGF